jgi:3-deoxy-D-manno-octulosonic-acid transferase
MKLIWTILYKLIFNPLVLGLLFPFLLFSRKARQSLTAHAGLFNRVKINFRKLKKINPVVWIHVASAGEYLQAKSLVQILIRNHYTVFVTVTSISGYNWLQREKNDKIVFDFLPLDFSYNAKRMLKLVQPVVLIFVKTDIWPNVISQAKKNGVPTALICAPERSSSSSIKKSFYRFLYSDFTAVFSVTAEGENFYKTILNPKTILKTVGDGKYDIVLERKKEKVIHLSSIKTGDTCALLGSAWPEDLKVIAGPVLTALRKYPNLKIIIAPHENDEKHVGELLRLFRSYNPVLFGDIKSEKAAKKHGTNQSFKYPFRVLVVNTIGDLFFLYENSSVAYVGGGFSTGIHNILEPCAMQNAVIFGPRYQKFPEAKKLVSTGGAFSINNAVEFEKVFNDLILNKKMRLEKAKTVYQFITRHKGASQKLYDQIRQLKE